MSEDETPPPRFAGRTYSRSKQNPAGRGLDDTADGKTVPLKASVSISKWGKANYVPFREGSDGSTDAKRLKLESKGEDPFSFDTDDKRKPSPTKKAAVPPPQEPRHATKLPASRIVLKEEGTKKIVDSNKDDTIKSSTLRTYARTTAKPPIILDQFIEVGKTEITESGETKFYPGINLAAKDSLTDMNYVSEDDEIFPVEFKRDPLKTYSGEVVTPIDKPDSPPPRKSGYKKKGGPRGRKPLTESDPGLIEEYKRNYAAQQLKVKPDTATGGLNNSTVVSKQEVVNQDQGTTVVVVCKPKKPVEKVETHVKIVKQQTVPKSKGLFTITLEPPPQEPAGENGNAESAGSSPVCVPNVSVRASARIKNSSLVAANSEGISSSQSSNARSQSSQSTATPDRRLAHDKSGVTDSSPSPSVLTPSSIDISQGETSTGRGKRYRIFKSRAPHVEEELKPPVFGDELDDNTSLRTSDSQQLADGSQSSGTSEQDKVVYVEIEKGSSRGRGQLAVNNPALMKEYKQNYTTQQLKKKPDRETGENFQSTVVGKVVNEDQGTTLLVLCKPNLEELVYLDIDVPMEDSSVTDLTPKSSQNTSSAIDTMELDADPSSVKQIDSSAARESLAARLRNLEKNNDSDSTGEPDNMSESSENLHSQGSPLNSQSTIEDGSQKEASSPPRKFFKSKKFSLTAIDHHRKLLGGSPQKGSPAKVTYNARTWNNENDVDEEKATNSIKTEMDEDIVLIKDSSKGPKLKREVHYPERHYDEAYTSLRVSKTHKELYTVVHHVKQSHEVQELGETQDFMDEVDYLLDSLQDTKSKSIRCLSCLKLAGKCISPAFRMHMRAHGTVTKIFSLLHDACSDPCLALSTSAMMFMLSRDRLNMDLDKDSLNLMLKLNEVVDTADRANVTGNGDLEKTKQRVQELLAQLQLETHAREIDLGFVSTGSLALESLLSLTSRRAGEWFKEELRSFGGLDHIVDSVRKCEKSLPEDLTLGIQNVLPVLRKLDRCLRVLENISFMNSDNQNYLIAYKNATLLESCTRLLRICQKCMPMYTVQESIEENRAVKDTPGFTVLTCMLAVLRVLLNVTHEHKLGDLDPSDETSLMATIVKCLTTTQWCIPMEQRFDLAILCLGLLINMVENRETNRKIMMEMETQVKYTEKEQPKTMSAIKAVVELFVQREQAARELEEDTETTPNTSAAESPNKSGEWKESDSGIEWITNSLKKAKEEEEKSKTPLGSNKGGGGGDEEANQTILEDDDETFTRALLKAGKHMENSIVASYAGLLLGTTIINSKEYGTAVKQLIPHEDFGPMIKMLKKFLNFMSLTTAFGSTDVNNITKVINVLESA